MGATTVRVLFRVRFTDYIQDPDDPDCLRRSKIVPADRVTHNDGHLALWLEGTEVARFSLDTVESIVVEAVPSTKPRKHPDEIRVRYPNVGLPWSADDDTRLLTRYRAGQQDYDALGEEFGRQPGAIRSRLAKLGLEQL